MKSFIRKKEKLDRKELASFLKTTPEALKRFEDSYQYHAIDQNPETGNLFDEQKKSMPSNDGFTPEQEACINRVVNEFLSNSKLLEWDGVKLQDHGYSITEKALITEEDLDCFSRENCPQATGIYSTFDLREDGDEILLWFLQRSETERDPQKKKAFYERFRNGLDLLDLTPIMYEILGKNWNSMENWFPQLIQGIKRNSFFQVPKTKILTVPLPLLQLSRIQYESLTPGTMEVLNRFCIKVFGLQETQEYFVKTGVFSSKFNFRNCHVVGAKEVRELGEYLMYIQHQACMLAGPLNSIVHYGMNTTRTWVVREFIKDKEDNPCIYQGMPLHTEYRVFVDFDTKEILGINPYWDPDIMKQRFEMEADADSPHNIHDSVIYRMHEGTLMQRYKENKDLVLEQAKKANTGYSIERTVEHGYHAEWNRFLCHRHGTCSSVCSRPLCTEKQIKRGSGKLDPGNLKKPNLLGFFLSFINNFMVTIIQKNHFTSIERKKYYVSEKK